MRSGEQARGSGRRSPPWTDRLKTVLGHEIGGRPEGAEDLGGPSPFLVVVAVRKIPRERGELNVDPGGEERIRECWLVRRGEQSCEALLDPLSSWMSSRDGAAVAVVNLSPEQTQSRSLSERSTLIAQEAGVGVCVGVWEEGDGMEEFMAALESLKASGQAAGPAALGAPDDAAFFKLDAAMACVALKEAWEMESLRAPSPALKASGRL